MSELKTFASLGPMLLARKGGATPAMRRQVGPMGNAAVAQAEAWTDEELEDLGWNDMGEEEPIERHEAEIVPLKPVNFDELGTNDPGEADAFADDELAFAEDASHDFGNDLGIAVPDHAVPDHAAPNHRPKGKSARKPAPRRRAIEEGRRAAFTLRLDEERHLKLRLASTVKARSAQYLVTKALDQFLADIPELDALAAQVKRNGSRPKGV